MSVDELRAEALRLEPRERAHLARELLASLDGMSELETGELWTEEAVRRDEELDGGLASSCLASEVLARARARRG